jgi:hypothetical protein
MRWLILLLALGVGAAGAQAPAAKPPAPPNNEIGSWIIACPVDQKSAEQKAADATPCRMRYRSWIVPPRDGRPSVGLEARNIGTAVVPQLAVRDLPAQIAMAALLAATPTMDLRFDGGQKLALTCGQDADAVLCTPAADAADTAAVQFKTAHSVQVHVHVALTGAEGTSPVPDQTRSFELSRTAEAIERFRAVAPTAMPLSPGSGVTQDLRAMADRMLKAMGYPGGISDLVQQAMNMVRGLMGRAPKP